MDDEIRDIKSLSDEELIAEHAELWPRAKGAEAKAFFRVALLEVESQIRGIPRERLMEPIGE